MILYIVISAFFFSACGKDTHAKVEKEQFTDEIRIKTTPVKDQGTSTLCWVYAMLATIESEHIMMGDSVNLSTDYVARMFLEEQTRRFYLSRGKQEISLRGMSPMLIHLIHLYGVLPYDSYSSNTAINYNALTKKMMLTAQMKQTLSELNKKTSDIADNAIGFMPKKVFMLGFEYTPEEFANSVCRPNEYIGLTSFTHHPFDDEIELEVPDNQMHDTFMNIPIDSLMTIIDKAISNGHPVCWEGDVSEKNFSFVRGTARLDNEKETITQQKRQRGFETLRTTDDHCMEIIGRAHDKNGKKYYICKNSWGVRNPYKGMMYLSEKYIKMKTIAIILSNEYNNSRL